MLVGRTLQRNKKATSQKLPILQAGKSKSYLYICEYFLFLKLQCINLFRPPPPPSSVSRSSSRKSSALSKNKLTPMYSKPPSRLHAPTIHPPPQRRGSNISISSCPIPFNRCSPNQSSPTPSSNLLAPAEQHRRASVTGSFTTHQNAADFASKSHGIQVNILMFVEHWPD